MKPVILFRPDRSTEKEFEICKSYLPTYSLRSEVPKNSLVIGRYSVLPFYKELEEDLEYNGSKLINSFRQYRYISNLENWYEDFYDLTPKTWFKLEEIFNEEGPFILKGETNSKKHEFLTHMYANNFAEAVKVYSNLEKDSLIGQQNICIRKFVPLKSFKRDLMGFPVTEEYRFFIFKEKVIASGFYWSSHYELLEDTSLDINPEHVPKDMLQEIIDRVGKNSNAFVVDIARTAQPFNPLYNKWPEWMIVEFNDFSMSGLSECDPHMLYSNLKQITL